LGRRDEANKDVVESFEFREREEARGLKPGLCAAAADPRWLGLRAAGEYDLFAGGGGEAEGVAAGVECPDNRSSHIASF
jgi:hypothetical protein